MSDVVLSAVLRAFDLCVIECSPTSSAFDVGRPGTHEDQPGEGPAARHASLRLLTPAPDWLISAFAAAPTVVPTFGDALPFLDHFLVQAEAVWHEGHPASASSDPFIATINGREHLLRAVAMNQHEQKLIILQRLTGDADHRPILQRAREQALEQEQLVQRVGTLHGPAAALDRDIKELLAMGSSPEHTHVVERLGASIAEVQGVLAGLPAPPSRHRRQSRTT
jgi:hypothetical protein